MRDAFRSVGNLLGALARWPRGEAGRKTHINRSNESWPMEARLYRCAARTHVGLKRKLNEDAIMTLTDAGLWAVSDGMGGHHAGDVASAMVIDALSRGLHGGDAASMANEAIAILEDVNSRLIALADGGPGRRTIGATIVGLAASNGRFACFWAGDSRAYQVRSGSIKQLTHGRLAVALEKARQRLMDAQRAASGATDPTGMIAASQVAIAENAAFNRAVSNAYQPGGVPG